MNHRRLSTILLGLALACLALGALDPLEGSGVILIGSALGVGGTTLRASRHRRGAWIGLALTALGVAIMFGWSALGGFGEETGISNGFALTLLPYPIGWIASIVSAVRALREGPEGESAG